MHFSTNADAMPLTFCKHCKCIINNPVKLNALMLIYFNGTNFINARLTQRTFFV